MHILHLYKDYFPILGGIENHLRDLGEGLAARGHRVTALVTSLSNRTEVERPVPGLTVIKAARALHLASTPLSLEMLRQARRIRADIVHLHFPYPPADLAYLAMPRRPPLVITYHSDIVRQQALLRAYRPLLGWSLRHAARIIATSPNYIVSSPFLRRHAARCAVIPLGVDIERFAHADERRAAEIRESVATDREQRTKNKEPRTKNQEPRTKNQEPRTDGDATRNTQHATRWMGNGQRTTDNGQRTTDKGLVLFVGRLRYYKGLHVLLDALPMAPGATLLIGGSGPERDRLAAQAAALGVAERVHFLGDVSDEDLPALFRAADVFVLPAHLRAEALGVAQIEALASGVPCISTELGTGTSYANQHGETGLVVPPGDPAALAQAINALLADPDMRRRFGQAGRRRVAALFTRDRMLDAVEQIYRDVLVERA